MAGRQHALNPVRQRPAGAINRQSFTPAVQHGRLRLGWPGVAAEMNIQGGQALDLALLTHCPCLAQTSHRQNITNKQALLKRIQSEN